MSMRIYGRQASSILVAPGTDEVMWQYPLPAGCSLEKLWGEVSVLGAGEASVLTWPSYGILGVGVPVLDPDAQVNVDTLWDQLVPKDIANAAGVFDLDTAAVDATPEFEMGEPDWGAVMGIAANRPQEFFRRRSLLTAALHPSGWVTGTPPTWFPTDYFKFQVKKPIRSDVHSHLLMGFSSPNLDVTTATVPTTISETQWPMMTYMEEVLKDATKNILGLIEAGAESPYVESAALINQLIENVVFEEVGASWIAVSWTVVGKYTSQVRVPGTIDVGILTSE